MSSKKIVILSLLGIMTLAAFVYGFKVLAVADVVPPGNCKEVGYEFPNPGIKPQYGGCIQGAFAINSSNGTTVFNGTFCEICNSPTSIIELVCGKDISPVYANKAAAIEINCTTDVPQNATTQGICVTVPISTLGTTAECH